MVLRSIACTPFLHPITHMDLKSIVWCTPFRASHSRVLSYGAAAFWRRSIAWRSLLLASLNPYGSELYRLAQPSPYGSELYCLTQPPFGVPYPYGSEFYRLAQPSPYGSELYCLTQPPFGRLIIHTDLCSIVWRSSLLTSHNSYDSEFYRLAQLR